MAVEFRVLGPLEIRRGGAPVPLRAPAQRTFLAALLIEHGRVVSVDSLAEALWPDEQPRSARHALEMNASRVRRLLGDDASVVARSPGYVLEVDPATIDSVRFERLLAEARELQPARRAARAADALALWRGPAYADFTFAEFAQEEIARLEELRHEAEEERVAAELELGRAVELIGELEALVAAAPLRERRRAQLMLALYRAGRQADALAAFREARELLLDGLGLEPGPELRELERAILQQDPALAGGSAVRPTAGAARRPASVVAVEPGISLELDPEEHERQKREAAELVVRVAEQFDALQPEPFVLAFAHEDHAARAAAAAAALGVRVGIASGDALVGEGGVAGPLIDLARQRAREGGATVELPAVEERFLTPFVGRDHELARLRDAQVALVAGPPGIGKSRLLYELARTERVAVGRCRAYGGESLAPLHELAEALGARGALADARAEEIPLTLRRLCDDAIVAFDDVQWADQLVLDTIEYLAAHVRVVCLAREDLLEERPSFLPGAERIVLAPLADDEAAQLAEGDAAIVERAEGNPLFIEQLRAHAAESDEALPPTLHALLAARLDRLTPSERAAIQRAAALGRDFDAAVVDARPALASLVRRSLLEPAPPTAAYEERFRFAHALIREAAYESIPHDERARLHEELADTLDARGASDEVVGFHLERAAELWPARDRHALRLADDAGTKLAAAGIATWKRGDARGAVALLRRSVELRDDGVRRDATVCELGCALATLGDRAGSDDAFLTAERSSERRIAKRAQLERRTSAVLHGESDPVELLEMTEEAIPLFELAGDTRALGRAWMIAGWVRGGALGQNEAWHAAAERALRYYVEGGWPTPTCIGHIAAALYHGPAAAPDAIARCRSLLEADVADRVGEATVAAYLGGLLSMAGEHGEAEGLLARSRSLYVDLGLEPALVRTCVPIEARAARLRAEPEVAAELFHVSCRKLLDAGGGYHLATQAAELADVLAEVGRIDEAAAWLAISERNLRRGDADAGLVAAIARARMLVRTAGATAQAEAEGREAVARADATDDLNRRAAAHLVLAAALDGEAASAEVERARALFLQKGNVAALRLLEERRAAATS